MRGLRRALVVFSLLTACAEGTGSAAEPYLVDARYRRSILEASLVNPHNEYSRLRLAHYATGETGDWERLPEWNPRVAPVERADLGPDDAANAPLSAKARALAWEDTSAPGEADLVALGREAFARYPVQLEPALQVALTSPEAAQKYGLWLDDARGVGGLVRVQMADGTSTIALTCASCHAARLDGRIQDGLANAELDLGRILRDADASGAASPEALTSWGAGRVDVTTHDGSEPQRIPDLRPVRWLTHLHQDATVALVNRDALAIRLETLIITSHGQVLRPPRLMVLALARYLETLAETLPGTPPPGMPGAKIFESACSTCHELPSLTGPPVALVTVGTDAKLGNSAERGTGMYRVPSLHGVGTRGPLLHDGSVPTLDALFDPSRLSTTWTGRLHGTGAVPGHVFGLSLPESARRDLLEYLRVL